MCTVTADLSEIYFPHDLNQSWSGRADDLAKIRVANIAIHRLRAVKLRMIECVKCLHAKYQRILIR